jgi:hypothetical protein
MTDTTNVSSIFNDFEAVNSSYFDASYSLCDDGTQAYSLTGVDGVYKMSNSNVVYNIRNIIDSASDTETIYTRSYNIILTAKRNIKAYFDLTFIGTADAGSLAMGDNELKKSEIRLIRANKTLFSVDTNNYAVGEQISDMFKGQWFYINEGDTLTFRYDIKFLAVDNSYGWYYNLEHRFAIFVDDDYIDGDTQYYSREDTRYLDADGLTQLCNLVGSDINSLKSENEQDKYCSYNSVELKRLENIGSIITTIENVSKYKFFRLYLYVSSGSVDDGSDITYTWPSLNETRYITFIKPEATTSKTIFSVGAYTPVLKIVKNDVVDIKFFSTISCTIAMSKYDADTDSVSLYLSASKPSYCSIDYVSVRIYGFY